MKTKKYYLILVAVTGILSAPALAEVEPTQTYESALIGRANPALAEIRLLRVVIESLGTEAGKVGLDLTDLQDKVESKLKEAGIEVFVPEEGVKYRLPIVSLLEVCLEIHKVSGSQQYVFRIQTSLSQDVRLRERDLHIRAHVWKTQPAMQTVLKGTLPIKITNIVLQQVQSFILAYQVADPPDKEHLDNKVGQTVSQTTQKQQSKPAAKPITAQYNYLASKNSKVFHSSDCSSAKRIKQTNLII
ncbi:MAG: hypothetical protein ACYS0I_18800, partial [Planctomycetota bacterium]